MATDPGEGPGESGEIADRGRPPRFDGPVRRVQEGDDAGQRSDVLVVVPHDRAQDVSRPATQEAEVAGGDLPAVHVVVPGHPEQDRLDRLQPGVDHPVAEHPADDREEIQVAVVRRRVATGEPIPGDQQRPVEPAPVVGHEPGVRRDVPPELVEQGRFIGVIRQQQLDLAER